MKTHLMIGAAALMALSACAPTPADSLGGPPEADRVEVCQAKAFQFLVGRPRAEIPAVLPTPSRVVADNQPVTMDYNPSRLNIVWNHETGRVEHVRCG